MSLEGFYRGLGALASNPDLVRRSRDGDFSWVGAFDLSPLELDRLRIMASDDGMAVTCSLYRSNRLTALVRTVPTVVEALGTRLGEVVTEFWIATPRSDMQFRTEGAGFCDFARSRYPDDDDLVAVVEAAETVLVDRYDRAPRAGGAQFRSGSRDRRSARPDSSS